MTFAHIADKLSASFSLPYRRHRDGFAWLGEVEDEHLVIVAPKIECHSKTPIIVTSKCENAFNEPLYSVNPNESMCTIHTLLGKFSDGTNRLPDMAVVITPIEMSRTEA